MTFLYKYVRWVPEFQLIPQEIRSVLFHAARKELGNRVEKEDKDLLRKIFTPDFAELDLSYTFPYARRFLSENRSTKLRVLSVKGCAWVDDATLELIVEHCPSIGLLDISFCQHVSGKGTKCLVTQLAQNEAECWEEIETIAKIGPQHLFVPSKFPISFILTEKKERRLTSED